MNRTWCSGSKPPPPVRAETYWACPHGWVEVGVGGRLECCRCGEPVLRSVTRVTEGD